MSNGYKRSWRTSKNLHRISVELGATYRIAYLSHGYECKFIKVTDKGYNFLILESFFNI